MSFRESGRARRGAYAGRLGLAALAVAVLTGSQAAHGDHGEASAARVIQLNESGQLRATSKQEFTLNERGSVAGTVGGTIYIHLTVVSTSRVTAEFNIYPRNGSISGYATASYRRGSETGSFSGSMSVTRGTGDYTGAHGAGLSFSGTIRRSNDAITVHMSGPVSD